MNRWHLGGLVGIAGLLAALVSGSALAGEGRGHGGEACLSRIVGTYLTTIEDGTGAFASRSLISFHRDGTVAAVDARQSSGVTGTSFSAQRGSYGCRGWHRAVATMVDFGFPPDENIGRFDLRIRLARDRTIKGSVVLSIFTPLETCNPFEAEATCTLQAREEFRFSSVRVPSRVD